jgi:hypothetical protein
VIVITKFNVTKGYEVWKKAFDSNEAMRLQRNVRVLAYGHENGNENSVYTVVEMNSARREAIRRPRHDQIEGRSGRRSRLVGNHTIG